MKIAFVVEGFPILSQTFILNQITGLIDRGHDVDIYAELPSDTQKVHPDLEAYNLLDRTYYHPPIPKNKIWRYWIGMKLAVAHLPKNPGLVLRSLNIFKYGKDATSLRLLYAVIPFIAHRRDYDIIQCHFGLLGRKGMLLRDIGAIGGRLVTAFHGVDISQNLQLLGEHVYDDLYAMGDHFLPISDYWQRRLIQLGCDPQKITVHHMGIDCQKFTFTPRTLKAPLEAHSSIQLITIARLTEKKGVEYAIRAVAKILKHYPQVKYSIIGDGGLREPLTRLIHTLGVENNIELLGWQGQREVVAALNQAHILLAPSVTATDGNQEGIPVVLMEAMAMGLPVLSTHHTGIPELVEDGVSGFLVPERDVDALAEKLHDLLQNSHRWVAMGQAGRQRVEQEFDIHTLNNHLVNLYQQLVESGPCPSSATEPELVIGDRALPANL